MDICVTCEAKLIDFYHFVRAAEQTRTNQKEFSKNSYRKSEKSDVDPIVYSTWQIVMNYIKKHSIADIREEESEQKLVITPKPNAFQELARIKNEPVEDSIKREAIEVNIKDDPDLPFMHFISSLNDSSCEALTNSSESSLSRLPAFEENTYFDGDKFVLRSEVPPKKLKEAKKRQKRPELWATNVQKKLRNAGKRYRSSKGYIVEARAMAEPCHCRQECRSKVNEKNRQMNFTLYWSLDDIGKKRKFISEHIKLEKPMRALKKSRAFSRLILHYLSVANSDGTTERIRVCKKMFLNTLNISNTVITTVVKLSNQYSEESSESLCKT